MAISKETETKSTGGVKRNRILVKTDAIIAVTTTPTSAGTINSDLALKKNLKSSITALDANKGETAGLIGVQGRVLASGAGVFTIYLWAALGVNVPANGYIAIDVEEIESNVSE